MKIHVDLSLFCGPAGAFGNSHGELELLTVPSIGSSITFLSPRDGVGPVVVPGFTGCVKVTDVRLAPVPSKIAGVSLSLEDLVLHSESDARKVMRYLEEGFGLFGDEYE
jgi:hypothetical protein